MMNPARTAKTELPVATEAPLEIEVVPVITDSTLLAIEVMSERKLSRAALISEETELTALESVAVKVAKLENSLSRAD